MNLQVTQLRRRLAEIPTDDRERRARIECALVDVYRRDPSQQEAVLEVFDAFAMSFARRMKRGEEPLEDLRQVARYGLLKALKRFDPTVGRSFTAYAAPTILGELRRHYRDTGWAVHVPRGQQELAQKVVKAARAVEILGLDATPAIIAEHSDLTAEQVVEGRLAQGSMRTSSLDQPVDASDSEAKTIGERKGDIDPGFERADDRATLQQLTSELPDRDREILSLRFGAQLAQSEIGRRVGISQMQVSRELRRIVGDLGEQAARA